jgi:ribonuclease HI
VLKAKYFPHGNILDIVFASNPSPAWKGTDHGIELLKEGIINHIGDGRCTHILRDSWIPRSSGTRIEKLKKNSRRRWVNQLMTLGTNSWNMELLRELFYEHDVAAICQIKIPESSKVDCVAWNCEKNGLFTVKSAYRLANDLKTQKHDNTSSSGAPNGNRIIWNTIWKSNVPPKIRIFGWRVATDTLDTKKNKWRRTLEVDSRCSICGNGDEDAFHATITCTKAKALRHELRKSWDLPSECIFAYKGADWLQIILDQSDDLMRARILLMLWRAWHLRNDVIHSDGKASVTGSVMFLHSYLHDLRKNPGDLKGKQQTIQEIPTREDCRPTPSWTAPAQGWIKLNTDGSFDCKSRTGGAGAIARDHNGNIVAAGCSFLPHCHDAEEAEARATLMGIQLIAHLQQLKLEVEVDCSSVAVALKSKEQDRSNLWTVYEDAKLMLKGVHEYNIKPTNRACNRVDDALAKTARTSGDRVLRTDIPIMIGELVRKDLYSIC